MIFALKKYQTDTLEALKTYLEAARTIGAKAAYDGMTREGVRGANSYRPLQGLETIPYVCLRLPTGGGKTLLSAHTVKIAAEAYLERDYPLVLWLVPTNTIRAQTLETLQKPGHPNYEALRTGFDGRFRVLDIADFTQLTPTDLATQACVVVGTFATLRVNNPDGRKVYAHNENLEPHFTSVPANAASMDRKEDDSSIKFSFRNVLALHRPLVVVDEAHNNTSSLSVEVLQRVNAACVVEFTATPANDSNILHNVSATELKTEDMIKLPIRLSPHNTWEEAVRDSILNRQRLHDLASGDAAYIRPIVLFQAEEKGKEVTKEVLLKHLIEQEKIPREKIAVVTGDQKELDGINLFARDCLIDYVITVEALKEGWDCSFAYVFCSVASIYSKKDVEQILGRVLRMPYAKRRAEPDLNRAYAHVSKSSWQNAVRQLHDSLVDMGFEKTEAASFIDTTPLPLEGGGVAGLFADTPAPTVIELAEDISHYHTGQTDSKNITIEKTSGGSRIILNGSISFEALDKLKAAVPAAARQSLDVEIRVHNAKYQRSFSPAARGISFLVPQLYFNLDGDLTLAEKDAFLDVNGWNLANYPADVSEVEFKLTESGVQWEIDLSALGKLTEKVVGTAEQYDLDLVDTGWTQNQLCSWLERKVRQDDVTHPILIDYVRRALVSLLEKRGLPLTMLARWRYVLAKVLIEKIHSNRTDAGENGYQKALFAPQAAVETRFDYAFNFRPDEYAPHSLYVGHPYQFQKHYYAGIGELENKGEEFDCARAIDLCKGIKHWVRNLDHGGFWLPLAKGKFYPDFVAELEDGRILVIEHKGKIYATNEDSKAKACIGALWEERSGGKALFLMTVAEKGRPSLDEQINRKMQE
ncbi:MAG: DEAD/DEAH box helicase [Holosporaceae bacterium]|jgi:type III restriction enzyme|nr:DEAD/DEAH box helicase family protein [Rhodospirillaceae bacterium]